MSWNLFLDDERNLKDVTWAPEWVFEKYFNERWTVARNWEEVAYWVAHKGFPKFISFDHDLGKDEKTGYDIIKLMIEDVMNSEYEISEGFDYYVHSKNPVGKKNIESYLNNFIARTTHMTDNRPSQRSLRAIANAYIKKGNGIADDAAYSGEMGDRGGGQMVREAQAFLAGLDGRLPEHWEGFVADIRREEQKEREEYQRLKAKFEGPTGD